jgi:hypothetical protein
VLSITTKHASNSSTDQGGGKRRGAIKTMLLRVPPPEQQRTPEKLREAIAGLPSERMFRKIDNARYCAAQSQRTLGKRVQP